ncbi:hypothetical protein GUK21_31855 [Rhizobium leguminosarum]|uniref:hypothetical protein n=1 Tax=Rhizobium ruizarguesonis TaxID=2081791 RepID=UPI0013C916EA|nr:hypothetical protein [Rhizobium ruizarguesonis]NEJ60770.1 hypothetical protein [Rhizobium ruizarguesonis]
MEFILLLLGVLLFVPIAVVVIAASSNCPQPSSEHSRDSLDDDRHIDEIAKELIILRLKMAYRDVGVMSYLFLLMVAEDASINLSESIDHISVIFFKRPNSLHSLNVDFVAAFSDRTFVEILHDPKIKNMSVLDGHGSLVPFKEDVLILDAVPASMYKAIFTDFAGTAFHLNLPEILERWEPTFQKLAEKTYAETFLPKARDYGVIPNKKKEAKKR